MEKIWLKNYPPHVPATINPDEYSSLVELFEKSCVKFADKPAINNLGVNLTYRELETKTRDFAAFLQKKLGLGKGDRIAIMLPNLLQYPVALLGALRAGLTIVNVNPLYTPHELEHQLQDAGAETILVLANFAHNLQQALPKTQIKNVVVTEIGDLLGCLKGSVVNFVVKHIKKMVPAWDIPSAISFRKALNKGKHLKLDSVTISPSDIAFLQYTGGTTGVAKGAMLSHRNMVANVLQCLTWLGGSLVEGEEIVIVALPLYHIFSLTACCLTFLPLGALAILITNPRDIPGFVQTLSKQAFTIFVGVNTLFNGVLNNKDFLKLNFQKLKLSVAGGMALQKSVAERWHDATGDWILEGYGLTEASPVVTINPIDKQSHVGSIGLPVSSTDISIRDEAEQELEVGGVGELCVKGPQVMQGYWQQPEETKKAFTQDGWLKTGDIAMVDEMGMVHLVDRKKDMVLVSGFNVYPNEVEEVLAAHPGVKEVGVIGVPAAGSSGEAVKAFVVRKDPNLTTADLIGFAQQSLTHYKIPKIIEFCEELPKSPVGKILRRELREKEAAQ
jgi:long-chain acyl-CoA synthetase